jgi:secreted PhoX family phosphatase
MGLAASMPVFIRCSGAKINVLSSPVLLPQFHPLGVTTTDDLVLAEGFQYHVIARAGDILNEHGERFGFNSAFTAFQPLVANNPDEGLLWVGHDLVSPIFASGWKKGSKRTREQVEQEMLEVGGSILHIRKDDQRWHLVKNSHYNRRLTAQTPMPLVGGGIVSGGMVALGTLANRGGTLTPWKTILACEGAYQDFYGDVQFTQGKRHVISSGAQDLRWSEFFPRPPEHYGWVVEVEPRTGKAKKLISMGRIAHSGAATSLTLDGRLVVYLSDIGMNEHLYKFVADKIGSLENGKLYVANMERKEWLLLERDANPKLSRAFVSQTELLIRTREAAKLLGATPFERATAVSVDPTTKAVIVAVQGNHLKDEPYGSIIKLDEADADAAALTFSTSVLLEAGDDAGIAQPSYLTFDSGSNLWVGSEIESGSIGKRPYKEFGNNGLFVLPKLGTSASKLQKIAGAPFDASLAGASFSSDGTALFLSISHPGERSVSLGQLTSHWPDRESRPKSSVVAVSGPSLSLFSAAQNFSP